MKKLFLLLILCSTIACPLFAVSPEVRISFPFDHYYDVPYVFDFSAEASDADGFIKKVEFFEGNTKIGEDTTAPYSIRWEVLASGYYNLTARATDNQGNVTTSAVVKLPAVNKYTRSPNIALNKPAFASTTEAPVYAPLKAVDGDFSTRWSSAFSDPQWVAVDLLRPYDLKSVSIRWEAAYARSYKIQVSNDSVNWTSIIQVDTNSSLTNYFMHETGTYETSGRYVRILGTKRGTGFGYSIYDLTIYGNPSPNSSPVVNFYTSGSNQIPNNDLILYTAASDPDGEITKVEIFAGSEKIAEPNKSGSVYVTGYSFGAPGLYNLYAVATDNHGIKTSSAIVPFQVVSTAQIIPVNIALNKPAYSTSNESQALSANCCRW